MLLVVSLLLSCSSRSGRLHELRLLEIEKQALKKVDTVVVTIAKFIVYSRDTKYHVDSYDIVDGWYLLSYDDKVIWIREDTVYKIIQHN